MEIQFSSLNPDSKGLYEKSQDLSCREKIKHVCPEVYVMLYLKNRIHPILNLFSSFLSLACTQENPLY